MMCKHPFIRDWSKVKRIGTKIIGSSEERLAATPLPCGRCLPCRINKRREWTHRIMLENHMHSDSLFCAFTYSDWHLPKDESVDPGEMKRFLARLRRKLNGKPFRYFAIGEYGGNFGRAHYHAVLFGLSKWHVPTICSAWSTYGHPLGLTSFDEVNQRTAQYIAGYTTKKLTKAGDPGLEGKKPEFMRSSRKEGGIGLSYIKKLGEQLKKDPHWEPRIINQLQWGKKSWPLGRYLTDKLAEYSGVSQEERERNLAAYQAGIFEAHLDPQTWFPGSVIKENEQKRRNQKKRYYLRENRGYVEPENYKKHKVKRMKKIEKRKIPSEL